MSKKLIYIIVSCLLTIMLGLAFFSMLGDSTIMDEVSHLPAGYSYIAKQDMRINPEHPPLIKDLAGGAVWLWSKISSTPINFSDQIPAWQSDINGQWDYGFNFMYDIGNDADAMLFFGRLPMLLILLLLGIYVFKWARELYGSLAGLLALFLYSFSPTFLAHGRFITTDVAAAAAIFIASYYFVRWLKMPTAKNLIIAGLVFGLAQLAKFSVFLLMPLFIFIIFLWLLVKIKNSPKPLFTAILKNIWQFGGGAAALMAIGYIFVVWPIYIFHILNYPIAMQQRDIKFIISSLRIKPIYELIYWLSGLPLLRALAQYGFGLAMVFQRATGGNTTYFLGEISNVSWKTYFPFVYLVKETLALHILTILALLTFVWRWLKNFIPPKILPAAGRAQNLPRIDFGIFIENRVAPILMLSFIALYWCSSIASNLNIGVRHVLPTFAFIFILVAGQIAKWFKKYGADDKPQKNPLRLKYLTLAALIVWQIVSVVSVYPSFLAYFNELIGGPANGYKYVADSNLDWGQDLKRLLVWTEQNNVNKIYLDYFGGASPSYYFGNRALTWHCHYPPTLLQAGDYLAISATYFDGGRGQPTPELQNYNAGCYNWLNNYAPTAIIGHSIFIYRIK